MLVRIGFARVAQESNALSPVRTEVSDFVRTHWLDGAALLRATAPGGHEAPGFLRRAELAGFARAARDAGVTPVPLVSAWAVPGGRLSAAAFAALRDALLDRLAAAPRLDGLFLSLHGALLADGTADPEAELLRAVRGVVGDVPVAVTLDLHAHLTRAKVELTDVLAAYRTNPHRDHFRVGRRAGALLIDAVAGRIRPTAAWRSLPMVLGGGTTLDFLPPMRGLFRQMRRMERDRRVLYTSLFMSHLWNDAPDLGWATHVVTDGAPDLAGRLADELADAAWSVRHELPPALPDAAEAVRRARAARWARRLGVVCISDASDMVGAGAAGESTWLLRELVEHGQGLRSYAPVRDDAAVEALWGLPEGEPVTTTVGGRLAPDLSPPLTVRGRLRRKATVTGLGRVVVLDLGHVQLVVTEAPPLAMKPSFYRAVGLPVLGADICVVKSLFPFRLYFAPYNRLTVYARTRGMTDLDAWRTLPHTAPVHPRDPVDGWRAVDRARRAPTG